MKAKRDKLWESIMFNVSMIEKKQSEDKVQQKLTISLKIYIYVDTYINSRVAKLSLFI